MRQEGFTLIELMVVISITAVLGALGIAGFSSYNQTQVLQSSANEVVTMLNLAKSRAQSQVKLGSSCSAPSRTLEGYNVGVSIANGSYTLSSRCSGITSNLETKTLPQNISFESSTSPTSFFFPVQTGGVQNSGCIKLSGYGLDRYITINSLGGVSVQLSNCITAPTPTPTPTPTPLPTSTPTPTPTLIPTATPTPVPVTDILTLRPNAVGDYTGLSEQYTWSGNHWEKVDEVTPDEDTTHVGTYSLTQQKDAYGLSASSIPDGSIINSVTVYWRWKPYGALYGVYSQPGLRLSGSETAGTEIYVLGGSYVNYNEALSRPGGGSWSASDFDNLQVVIRLRTLRNTCASRVTQLYVKVSYTH